MGRHQVGVHLPGGDSGLDVDVRSFRHRFLGDGGVFPAYGGIFRFVPGNQISFGSRFFSQDGEVFDF